MNDETRALTEAGQTLGQQLAAARENLARLELLAAGATCREVGCDMVNAGGCNAGCSKWCCCSVPVFVCTRCGDSDYGDNAEAADTRAECRALARATADHVGGVTDMIARATGEGT